MTDKCKFRWVLRVKNAKFSGIFTKFEDQGPEYDKDLGPGPPLRTV